VSITHSDLVAKLVIEGALAMVAGKVQGKAPVEGLPLKKGEREKLGLKGMGLTVFYPLGEGGVFFDMQGSTATVWYDGGDCERALGVFEVALKRAHATARQLEDTTNPNDPAMRSRAYQVELANGKLGIIDVAYPTGAGAKGRQFAVRVFAQQRRAN